MGVEVVDLSSSEDSDSFKVKQSNTIVLETLSKDNTIGMETSKSGDSDMAQVSREKVISEELSKIKDIPSNLALIQTFYEHPWFKKEDVVEYPIESWNFGSNCPKVAIRSATFRFLWAKGFYLTAGDKFGADFLAYPGDPVMFHATYVVICQASMQCDERMINEKELVAKCRLGTAVKKTILISYFEDAKQNCDNAKEYVRFKRLRWTASKSSNEPIAQEQRGVSTGIKYEADSSITFAT